MKPFNLDTSTYRSSLAPNAKPDVKASKSRRKTVSSAKLQKPLGDPRPLKDKGFQQNVIETVIDRVKYLDPSLSLTSKALKSLSLKTFAQLCHLLLAETPFVSCLKTDKAFPESVVELLTLLKYPTKVSKSVFASPGAQHTFPTVLGILDFFCALGMNVELANEETAKVPSSESMLFDEITEAYKKYSQGENELEEIIEGFVEKEKEETIKAQAVLIDLKNKELELDEEFEKINKADPASEAQRLASENEVLEKELVALQRELVELKEKQQADEESTTNTRKKTGEDRRMLKRLEKELKEKETALRPFLEDVPEIDTLLAQKEALLKEAEANENKLVLCRNEIRELGTKIKVSTDELAEKIRTYNAKAYETQLIPASAAYAYGLNYKAVMPANLEQALSENNNVEVSNASVSLGGDSFATVSTKQTSSVFGVDLKKAVKKALRNVCKMTAERLGPLERRIEKLQDEINQRMDETKKYEKLVKELEEKTKSILLVPLTEEDVKSAVRLLEIEYFNEKVALEKEIKKLKEVADDRANEFAEELANLDNAVRSAEERSFEREEAVNKLVREYTQDLLKCVRLIEKYEENVQNKLRLVRYN